MQHAISCIQTCDPFLRFIANFLITGAFLNVCFHLCINSIPQQANEQKSWNLVELLAWDTPVCISPDVC